VFCSWILIFLNIDYVNGLQLGVIRKPYIFTNLHRNLDVMFGRFVRRLRMNQTHRAFLRTKLFYNVNLQIHVLHADVLNAGEPAVLVTWHSRDYDFTVFRVFDINFFDEWFPFLTNVDIAVLVLRKNKNSQHNLLSGTIQKILKVIRLRVS